MPEDSIFDMANNIEYLYDDIQGLYRKWHRAGEDWDEGDARKEATALAAHLAESIETLPYIRGKYTRKDFEEAAEEMIEEFRGEIT